MTVGWVLPKNEQIRRMVIVNGKRNPNQEVGAQKIQSTCLKKQAGGPQLQTRRQSRNDCDERWLKMARLSRAEQRPLKCFLVCVTVSLVDLMYRVVLSHPMSV